MSRIEKGRRHFLAQVGRGSGAMSVMALAGHNVMALTAALWTGSARAQSAPSDAKAPPTRVVVIGGAVCECIYALDAGASLVGADITCRFPAAAGALPKIGYERSLAAEGMLSLHPDLVLRSGESGPPTVFAQLRDAGVRVVTMPAKHDANNVRDTIRLSAEALGVTSRANALLSRFDAAWHDTEAYVQAAVRRGDGRPVRAVFVMVNGGGAPMLAGSQTAADAMLRYAGAENAMSTFAGYRAATPEALLLAAPDVIVTTDDALQAAGGAQRFVAQPGFAQTPAGRAQRVIAFDTLFLLGFGPRLPHAVRSLAEGVHRG